MAEGPSIESPSYPGESSTDERTNDAGVADPSTTANDRLGATNAHSTLDDVFDCDPGFCGVTAPTSSSELLFPSQTSPIGDLFLAAASQPAGHDLGSHQRISPFPNDNYFDIITGTDFVTQHTVFEQRQSQSQAGTFQLSQTGMYRHSRAATPNLWHGFSLPRAIAPSSPVNGANPQRSSGSLFLEHVDMLESLVHQKFVEMEDRGEDIR